MEYRTVSAKLPVDELTMFKAHCEKKGVTPANLLRDLIIREMNITIPHRIAGRNRLFYNKEQDCFSWKIELDDGKKIEVTKNVCPCFIEDLYGIIEKAVKERNSFLNKNKINSVSIPSELIRGI